jgi:hypothetical protein
MAKTTIIFGIMLVILGLIGYFGTGATHPTALIPMWFGLALGIGGFLAISPSEKRRKIFMHINVTIGAIGLIGALVKALNGYGSARSQGIAPDMKAIGAQVIMAVLLANYVYLCVSSFIETRRAREREQ